jgi:4'-phosphopantetheinyl transferase EntD
VNEAGAGDAAPATAAPASAAPATAAPATAAPAAGVAGSGLDRLADPAWACGVALVFAEVREPGRAGDTAAGRRAASAALDRLDADAPGLAGGTIAGHTAGRGEIGRHDDGRPAWPAGLTGSIAHAGGLAVAAVARPVRTAAADPVRSAGERAVGVDVEVAGALPAADAALVLDPGERAEVAQSPHPDRLATLLWSAKEAAYKAWHTATDGGLVGVDPVDIHVELVHSGPAGRTDPPPAAGVGRVRATAAGRLAAEAEPVGDLHGWWVEDAGYVAVLLVSARRAARASARGPHQGCDGMASAATTKPSAANASTYSPPPTVSS